MRWVTLNKRLYDLWYSNELYGNDGTQMENHSLETTRIVHLFKN